MSISNNKLAEVKAAAESAIRHAGLGGKIMAMAVVTPEVVLKMVDRIERLSSCAAELHDAELLGCDECKLSKCECDRIMDDA